MPRPNLVHSKLTNSKIEINLFHKSKIRASKISQLLKKHGAKEVYGLNKKYLTKIPGLKSNRRRAKGLPALVQLPGHRSTDKGPAPTRPGFVPGGAGPLDRQAGAPARTGSPVNRVHPQRLCQQTTAPAPGASAGICQYRGRSYPP